MTVLNDILLFVGELKLITNYSIVTVESTDYKLTYIGTAKITVYDDDGNIKEILLKNALYFLTSSVNITYIGQLSQYYGKGTGNKGTYIKSTYHKS